MALLRYGFDDRRSILGRGWDFSSPPRPDWLWGSHNLLFNGYSRVLSPWVKWPGRDVAEVKNAGVCDSTPPYVFMACCLVKQWIHVHSAVLSFSQGKLYLLLYIELHSF